MKLPVPITLWRIFILQYSTPEALPLSDSGSASRSIVVIPQLDAGHARMRNSASLTKLSGGRGVASDIASVKTKAIWRTGAAHRYPPYLLRHKSIGALR